MSDPSSATRRWFFLVLALAAAALAGCGGGGGSGDDGRAAPVWRAAWAAAPQDYNEPIPLPGRVQPEPASHQDQTLRQVVRASLAGEELRVRLSNVFGLLPVRVFAAGIAASTGGSGIDGSGARALTFEGATSVLIPPGGEVWSDLVVRSIGAGAELAVSLYFQDATPLATVHRSPSNTSYLSSGNAVALPVLLDALPIPLYHLLSAIDVHAAGSPRVLAILGDSITDGMDAPRRYPDWLVTRIADDPAARGRVGVVNLGIAGNRVLNDKMGQRGVARFERDVLNQSGVTHALILLGTNDLGYGVFSGPPYNLTPPQEVVSAEQVIEGYRQMIARAGALGVKVMMGTLLPFKGGAYFNETTEARRQAINSWIRAQPGLHAVVDFDAALRNPADPQALNPAFDSGDHTHPSDAGHRAMAQAVDLAKLLE